MADSLLEISYNYTSVKDNLSIQLSLIDKFVVVEVIKNTKFIGFVHSIDPISKSIILTVPKGDDFQIVVIPGHAVLQISQKPPPLDVMKPTRKADNIFNLDISAKKSKLLDWLTYNKLPVTEVGDSIVFGNVSILPPYSVTDICTDNHIIATQVRKTMESMPANFNI